MKKVVKKVIVKNVKWFNTSRACIGIVQCEESGDFKYYIGTGNGLNEQADAEHIMRWGAKFPTLIGYVLFGGLFNSNII